MTYRSKGVKGFKVTVLEYDVDIHRIKCISQNFTSPNPVSIMNVDDCAY